MKVRKTIIFLLATALCAASCIYPFSAELEGEEGTLVIEGDILIGETTTVKLSYSSAISSKRAIECPSSASVWVEDDSGTTYQGTLIGRNEIKDHRKSSYVAYSVDLTAADPSRKYRLCVINNDNSREYASTWQRVCAPPQIDSLSYVVDRKKETVNIALSMHSSKESYFRWTYVEDWEYHAYYHADCYYTPPDMRHTWKWTPALGYGTIEFYEYPENTYYCWDHDESSRIMIFSTEKQTEDRFVDLEFLPIDRTSEKISYIYHIEVNLEPITRDAYLYWDTVQTNSEYNGSLFSPNPSEYVGNIRCQQDTTEFVLGYISAAQRANKKYFLYASDHRYYKNPDVYLAQSETLTEDQWYEYYQNGYLPYGTALPDDVTSSYWARKRCVDCRLKGGTQERPSFWVN